MSPDRAVEDIEPYGNVILVEMDVVPEQIGGIFAPQISLVRGDSGVIQKAPNFPGWTGRRVVLKPQTGTTVQIGEAEMRLVGPDDIMAFVSAGAPTAADFEVSEQDLAELGEFR